MRSIRLRRQYGRKSDLSFLKRKKPFQKCLLCKENNISNRKKQPFLMLLEEPESFSDYFIAGRTGPL